MLVSMQLLLGGGLLLVVLALLVTGRAGKGLFEDLKDLLIIDLLVRLVLGEIKLSRGSKLGDTVLGDSFQWN